MGVIRVHSRKLQKVCQKSGPQVRVGTTYDHSKVWGSSLLAMSFKPEQEVHICFQSLGCASSPKPLNKQATPYPRSEFLESTSIIFQLECRDRAA